MEDHEELEIQPDTLLTNLSGYFEMGVRVRKALHFHQILKVKDLGKRTAEEMLEIRNFGETSLRTLITWMRKKGIRFRDESPDELKGKLAELRAIIFRLKDMAE